MGREAYRSKPIARQFLGVTVVMRSAGASGDDLVNVGRLLSAKCCGAAGAEFQSSCL
jgi:hypothetical protein